jgi:protein subunit release factor B
VKCLNQGVGVYFVNTCDSAVQYRFCVIKTVTSPKLQRSALKLPTSALVISLYRSNSPIISRVSLNMGKAPRKQSAEARRYYKMRDAQWFGKMKQDVWTEITHTTDTKLLKAWQRRFRGELGDAVKSFGVHAPRTVRIAEHMKAIEYQLNHLKLEARARKA